MIDSFGIDSVMMSLVDRLTSKCTRNNIKYNIVIDTHATKVAY
jgi:hypothetical protein